MLCLLQEELELGVKVLYPLLWLARNTKENTGMFWNTWELKRQGWSRKGEDALFSCLLPCILQTLVIWQKQIWGKWNATANGNTLIWKPIGSNKNWNDHSRQNRKTILGNSVIQDLPWALRVYNSWWTEGVKSYFIKSKVRDGRSFKVS